VFLFAIALALNPHTDLWLDDTAFATKYCPAELDHLNSCIVSLAEATAAPHQARPGRRLRRALENLQWRQELTTEAARELEVSIGRLRDEIRSNPFHYTWPPRVTSPTTSGGALLAG
jgi:hypothetical protein